MYHSGRRDIVVGLFCWFGLVGGVFVLGWGLVGFFFFFEKDGSGCAKLPPV